MRSRFTAAAGEIQICNCALNENTQASIGRGDTFTLLLAVAEAVKKIRCRAMKSRCAGVMLANCLAIWPAYARRVAIRAVVMRSPQGHKHAIDTNSRPIARAANSALAEASPPPSVAPPA